MVVFEKTMMFVKPLKAHTRFSVTQGILIFGAEECQNFCAKLSNKRDRVKCHQTGACTVLHLPTHRVLFWQ